jgi:hypothetical protein
MVLLFVSFIPHALLNSTPQLLARDRRAVAQSAQLGPDSRMDATTSLPEACGTLTLDLRFEN